MKVELKEVENEGFKPFKIEITIETLAELKELHSRLCVGDRALNDLMDSEWCNNYLYGVFREIDNKLSEVDKDYYNK